VLSIPRNECSKALVVGAGPVGLVLANECAGYGIDFRILEKNATRSTWSKALMLTSRTMDILENIGLNEEILFTGTIVEGGDCYFNQKPLGSVTWDLPKTTRYPFPFINPQPECEAAFEHVLNKRGFQVEWNSEVVGVEVQKEYVEVSVKDSETIKARFVVG